MALKVGDTSNITHFFIYLPFFHPLEVPLYIFGVQKCHSADFSAVSQLVEKCFFDKLKDGSM